MAYMSQEKKAKISAALKLAIPKSWKWSLSVRHHSTIVLTISSAPVNLIALYVADERCSQEVRDSILSRMNCDVNPYSWRDHFSGADAETLKAVAGIFEAMNLNNHDRSDSQSDYFDVGHYVDVNLGKWNKPFVVIA